jgi:hypothetical protein
MCKRAAVGLDHEYVCDERLEIVAGCQSGISDQMQCGGIDHGDCDQARKQTGIDAGETFNEELRETVLRVP